MESIIKIEKIIRERTEPHDRIVNGLWGIACLFNPANNGRIFDYKILSALTTSQGCAYSMSDTYTKELLLSYIGKDFLTCDLSDIAIKVCLYDSIFGSISRSSYKRYILSGKPNQKLNLRSKIIVEQAKYLIGSLYNKIIVNVGVVGDILFEFQKEGANVIGTDYDTQIIGTPLANNIKIEHGSKTLEMISHADLAVITGMTITTRTIDDIIHTAQIHGVKIIVFAETGANLATYYIKHGVDVYLSERFPFYIFDCDSIIDVYHGG